MALFGQLSLEGLGFEPEKKETKKEAKPSKKVTKPVQEAAKKAAKPEVSPLAEDTVIANHWQLTLRKSQ